MNAALLRGLFWTKAPRRAGVVLCAGLNVEDGMTQTGKREAREQAFFLVFEMSFGDGTAEELAEAAAESRDAKVVGYAKKAAETVREHWEELDEIIDRFSTRWKVGRLPRVTASVLRLAICEMTWLGVPTGAAIDEAVELTKKYGGDGDPAYVNGVLGGYARSRESAEEKEEQRDSE